MKSIRTWILIANGSSAHMAEHTGPGRGLSMLAHNWTAEPEAEHADRSGRSFKRIGPTRHGFEPHGAGNEQHEAFARLLTGKLSSLHAGNHFDRLIVCAPPALLGTLRKHMPDTLTDVVSTEIAKDLTNIPAIKLPAHFFEVLAVGPLAPAAQALIHLNTARRRPG